MPKKVQKAGNKKDNEKKKPSKLTKVLNKILQNPEVKNQADGTPLTIGLLNHLEIPVESDYPTNEDQEIIENDFLGAKNYPNDNVYPSLPSTSRELFHSDQKKSKESLPNVPHGHIPKHSPSTRIKQDCATKDKKRKSKKSKVLSNEIINSDSDDYTFKEIEEKIPSRPPVSTEQLNELQSHQPPNDSDSNNCEVEVKDQILSKPPASTEQLKELSFSNCPSQDSDESGQLTQKIQISEKDSIVVTKDPNSNSDQSSNVVTKSPNFDAGEGSEMVTVSTNSDSKTSSKEVTESPNLDSENNSEAVTEITNSDSKTNSKLIMESPNSDSNKSSQEVTKNLNSDFDKNSKIVTKKPHPDSQTFLITKENLPPDSQELLFPNCPSQDLDESEQLTQKIQISEKSSTGENLQLDSPENVPEEIYYDAPEDGATTTGQPSSLGIIEKFYQKGIEPHVLTVKSKWHNFSKKGPAPDPNKLICSDKRQYIKKKGKDGNLYYSAKFILDARGEVSYEIFGKRNLLIADCDNFIARIEIAPGEELDFTKSFKHNKATLIGRVTIVKVLEDELLVQRNEAYDLFKKILEARSEKISDFQDFAEDFLQISITLKTYHFYINRPHLLLQEIMKNQFISRELKCIIEQLLHFEMSLQKRNKLFPTCKCPTYFTLSDLFTTVQNIRKNSLKVHKQNLKNKCSTQNSYLICQILEIYKLPVEKLLRVTNDDIKLFTDLVTLTNEGSQTTASIIPLKFIDYLWSHFYCKLSTENCISLMDSGSLTHPIYFFLVKSLRDLIEDITSKSTTTAKELFKKVGRDYVITKNISWSLNCSANLSLENQYTLVYELMKHFEPGNYTHKKKFKYKFALLENVDDSWFLSALKNMVIKNRNDLFNMPEERLIWLYIVDAGIAPILQGESNERFRKLSLALLTGFLKFVQNARHLRYESFRIAAHNIVKFAAQILPYFKVTNTVSQELDHSILDKQIDFIDGILASDEGDVISNLFSNLMEVYIEYWELRESIIGKLPLRVPCVIFKGLMDEIILKMLEIVDNTLSKQVELQLIIQYFRLFNEFVKHFKGINFAWFISKNIYMEEMKECVKEIKKCIPLSKTEIITYEVSDTKKFRDILKENDKVVPKHFLIETVLELLKIINSSLNKAEWVDESRLKAAGDLFLAIGHTFAHFEDQTDYTDIELFKRDCTTPFKSVIDNSLTYSDFKTRLDNVENYYLYARKQNQIGIETALDLCAKEVQKARESGFKTSINQKVLEECFNRYSEKLILLQKLDISAIVEDLREQLKKVDVLPFDRWTPHFKQTILPVLLANLAGIWTILESKDVANIEKRIEPHCIQIICVLRLIGADYLHNGVPKHFAQVLTGQGKSIILGLLSSLIALTGHKANIVCYSSYLAVRDQNAFSAFFETFEPLIPNNNINYYTFDNMAEDVLTRKINGVKVSLRDVVNDLILNKLETKEIEKVENPADSVLLIDEADVFFSENIYGQTYNPCSTIGMPALREIQPKLWEIVESGIYDKNIVLERIREFINELLKDEKYEDFKNFISCTSALFEENLDKMVTTAITVSKEKNNPDSWFVQKYKIDYKGFICYRERLGSYSNKTYISYNNVFNYFRLKKSNYDDKNFQNFGYFFVIWGYISYADLPLAYKNILGVSGTLMDLNDHEKRAIEKYGIDTISAMSSFFGDRKLKFVPSEHLTIQDSVSNWHSKIFDHISKIVQDNRACLVFFDTDSEIREFENKYRNNINRLYTLIGNEEPETIEWRINEAGVAQTVTLASRAMGRGIDYKSNDRSVEDLGGIHAIQTFFSLDSKEETQIQGRVARKDNNGSYELILCREHLKEIGCNEKSDGTPIATYQELCDARLVKANAKGATIAAKIQESEKEHNLTMAFLKSLTKYTPEEREMYFSKYPFVLPE
ncbi:uncharacterized protein [Parasteatoda tepidariorum]|nr:uncharacterized protein LOC107457572 [Parasteatoda tepidariorum]XP_042909236.1 uncharacterized protein LOC107457572 [Parasteatoda tepidariorum]XP_042909237.1 uncharacterized protein LOC107457572 [Parasteatoda tepidariorum]